MSSPLEAAGATKEASQYAALSMDRSITGLWTQRSPLRDADVPYVYGKFYSASRFDSIIDGINREITSRLTWARRAGSSVYNANTFPAANSFYSYNRISNGAEIIRVIMDGADGVIYDATAGQKSTIFTKSGGAGKARFQGVNTSLYFSDGVENKKWLQPSPWAAQTSLATTLYETGTTVLDPAGNVQFLTKTLVGTITNIQVIGNTVLLTFSATDFNLSQQMNFVPQGLSGAGAFLNGATLRATTILASGATFVVTSTYCNHAAVASTPNSGTAFTTDQPALATTGGSPPAFNGALGGTTTDGNSTWVNYGKGPFDWGPPSAPSQAPTLTQSAAYPVNLFWQPFTSLIGFIMDQSGNVWQNTSFSKSGGSYPNFLPPSIVGGVLKLPIVQDGGLTWIQCAWLGSSNAFIQTGPAGWQTGVTPFHINPNIGDVIVDSNGNLQQVTAGAGATGGAAPTWATTVGANTTDNGLTWTNRGPWNQVSFAGVQYGYCGHCIDGSLTSMSPFSFSTFGVMGGPVINGQGMSTSQVDSIWIFRTANGKTTPLLFAQIDNPGAGVAWSWLDQFTDAALDPFIIAPQNGVNDGPPVGMTAPVYHLGRMWGINENTVIASQGPDVIAGNGNTSFGSNFVFPIPEQPVRLTPTITQQGPAMLIWGVANIYVILGQGTSASPFQQAALYMAKCGILNYDAVTQIGSTFYAFGNTAKIGGNIVGKAYSLDPGAGYVEFGFPIGDQFTSVTTGTGGKTPTGAATGHLYNPSTTYVTWAELGSGDTALYVADGSVGWFRYSPVASPESGFLWSPRAVIQGGTSAVQGIETEPGVNQLLIGPRTSGPILFRDSTTHADNGSTYPSYDVKGCIQLCLTGEIAEIAHVHVVSMPVGAKPTIGILPDEILPSTAAPFTWLQPTSPEPPDLKSMWSQSVYSDRYAVMQDGTTGKCLFFQLGMDYGTQNFADETLMFSIYGAKYSERRQQ